MCETAKNYDWETHKGWVQRFNTNGKIILMGGPL